MQQLNASYDVILGSLEPAEPEEIDENENNWSQEATDVKTPQYNQEPEPKTKASAREKWRAKEERRRSAKRRKKQRQRQRYRQREMEREAMEKELREEQERWQQFHSKMTAEREKIRETSISIRSEQQRASMTRLFTDSLQSPNEGEGGSSSRPVYPTMETCTDDLVLFLRLGMMETVAETLNDEVDKILHNRFAQIQRQYNYPVFVAPEALGIADIRLSVMLKPRDSDGNTLLHYGVYFESTMIVRMLCRMAQIDHQLDKVFLAKNKYGHTPRDFLPRVRDPGMAPLLQAQQDLVDLYFEETMLLPAMRRAWRNLKATWSQVRMYVVMSSFLGILIATYGFQMHWAMSFLSLLVLQYFEVNDLFDGPAMPEITSVASMLSFMTIIKLAFVCVKFAWPYLNWRWVFFSLFAVLGCWYWNPAGVLIVFVHGPLFVYGYLLAIFCRPVYYVSERIPASWQVKLPGVTKPILLLIVLGGAVVIRAITSLVPIY